MCASLMRPTNTWSSDSRFIRLVLALVPPSPQFPPVQIHLPPSSPLHFPLPPPSHPSCCLSPPPLPPHALRVTTLFPFKIKIIKSATKWERLRCWRHHFDVLFQHYIININSSVPNYCCSRTVTHICTILASTQHIPLTPSHLLLLLLLLYTQRRIWHAKRYCLRF